MPSWLIKCDHAFQKTWPGRESLSLEPAAEIQSFVVESVEGDEISFLLALDGHPVHRWRLDRAEVETVEFEPLTIAGEASHLERADVNADGVLDLIVAGSSGVGTLLAETIR